MNDLIIVMPGDPRTKKNSLTIKYNRRTGRKYIAPSDAFLLYQRKCSQYLLPMGQILINKPINMKCVYYMKTRHKVDLGNLINATCDILVHYKIIEDDNSNIVIAHDGSRVFYDKINPRVEITISDLVE